MAKLPFYKDLKAKAGFFYNGSKRIDSKKDFDLFWERLHDLEDKGIYRFRGCSEAKYMMYTSAQRYWKEQELLRQGIGYHEFIQKLIGYSDILNQRGVFFFSSDSEIPLEKTYASVISGIKEGLGSELFEQKNYQDHFAECINMHKSLRPYALAKLKSEGITPEFIFPDVEKLKESVLSAVLTE